MIIERINKAKIKIVALHLFCVGLALVRMIIKVVQRFCRLSRLQSICNRLWW